MVKLIKSGFHKDRAILTVFMLIIILSTFLLHTGLLTSGYGALYDEYAEEEGLSDLYLFAATMGQDIEDVLGGVEQVESWRTTEVVSLNSFTLTTSRNSKKKDASGWMITTVADNCCCDHLEFVERDDGVKGKKIYLNIYTAYSNSLCVGDKVYIDSEMGRYEYTVAGIFQHLYMGNTYSYYGAMLEDEEYEALKKDSERFLASGGTPLTDKVVNVNVKEGCDSEKVLNDINAALLNEKGIYSNGITRELGAEGFTIIVNVMAGFMAAFAVLMLVICVIMIVFTISNNLDRDIINIGALRAVGFTVGQLRLALVSEYLLLGSIGSLTGISLSYAVYPVLEKSFIREISGLIWKNRLFPVQTFSVLAGVMLVILLTVFAATRKIRSLHPATALRFGLASNSFRKNYLPLASTRGELNLLLAVKSSLQSMGQGIIVFCIVTAVSFVTMFSLVMYYNTRVDISKFQRMINGDVPDAYVYLKDPSGKEVHRLIDKLKKTEGITQAYTLESIPAEIGDNKVNLIYTSDPASVDCGIYDGEMLREDNEAVIGSSLADRLGVGVGDDVKLEYKNSEKRFLITGIQQSALNSRLYITEKAAESIGAKPDAASIRIRVENADSKRVDDVLKEIRSQNDSNIINTKNEYKFQHSNENTPVFAVGFIVLILIVLNIATVMLVIRLLLKTVFIKKEKEFGIKKAVGFTAAQLRYQLSLSLMPTSVTAAAAGAAGGYFLINPMFTEILRNYGIRSADLIVKPFLSCVTALTVAVLVFLFSFMMSGRMKKLSAYKLIQE